MAPDSGSMAHDAPVCKAPQNSKGILRFITCGSVDDGKSTLIGRLLYESHALFDDQLAATERDSRVVGTRGGEFDYALLLDGLTAEREQGITIDVAYRYFSTARRKFIVADTPGHEQYTRNMVTAASTAAAAILLIDARKGALTQTRRHAFIVSLLGIRHVALAVNKMDLVGYSRTVYERIASEFRKFANGIGLRQIPCIPISAVRGDNVTEPLGDMPWYHGPTLLQYLESVPTSDGLDGLPFRMPVQRVTRPHLDFRGIAGTIVSGRIHPGDRVCVLPAGQQSVVKRIVTYDGDLDRAVANQAISLVLADDLDVSRGDVVSARDMPVGVGDRFQATIVWMHRVPLLRGRDYLLKIGTRTVTTTISPLKYKINVDTLEHLAAERLELNEIGVCELELDQVIAFERYAANRDLGGFILIDRFTNDTVGAGLLHFALRRSENVHWQTTDVDKIAHAALKRQRPCVVWMTGVSGAGKSTIANLLERRLYELGLHTCLLDGDNVRHGLNKDLGFTESDRVENVRRVAEVTKLMVDAGLIVIAALISPFRNERAMARGLLQEGEFCEVYVDTPIEVAIRRDPKGLYAKARRGELQNFTGIDSPYEPPEHPEIRIVTQSTTPEEAAELIVARLRGMGVFLRS